MAAIAQGMDPDHSFDMTVERARGHQELHDRVGKQNLYNIWVNYQDMWDDVQSGNVWATYAWPDAYVALKDKVDVKYVRPSTGTLAWVEGLVLRADTPNYHHAHAFADAWASPTVGEKLISTWGYGHSNLDVDLDEDRSGRGEGLRTRRPGGEPLGAAELPRPLPAAAQRLQPRMERSEGLARLSGCRSKRR